MKKLFPLAASIGYLFSSAVALAQAQNADGPINLGDTHKEDMK